MAVHSLTDIERAIRQSWCAETYPSESSGEWDPANPARDQCGVTALVVHALLGGDLVVGEVHVDGVLVDHHWWNRVGVLDVDLTREQFAPHEVVVGGEIRPRPPDDRLRRSVTEYRRLLRLAQDRLAGGV